MDPHIGTTAAVAPMPPAADDPLIAQPTWRILLLQYVAYLCTRTYFAISGTQRHNPTWRPEQGTSYIIAANHTSMFDPFVATAALGWPILRPLLPCRFMATPKFLSNNYLRAPMTHFGSFPSHPFRGWLSGLEAAHRIVAQQQTLVIFPQGRRTPSHDPADSKPGVILLGRAHPNTKIIPVLARRAGSRYGLPRYEVYSGTPVSPHDHTAESLMRHIFSLDQS